MPHSPRTCRLAATLAAVAGFSTATPALADDALTQVQLASSLTALVYEASASACMVNAGIDMDVEMQALATARKEFNATMQTLADDGLSDQAEVVAQAWLPLDEAFSMIVVGDAPAGHITMVNEARPALENATLLLADQASLQPEYVAQTTAADAFTVDLAERQEVLVQKMKLMSCEMNDAPVFEEAKTALLDTMSYYERSLQALTEGRPDLAIAAPTDYATQQVLAAALFDWQTMKPILATIAVTGSASPDALHRLRVRTDGLGGRMAELVDTYHAPADGGVSPQVAVLD